MNILYPIYPKKRLILLFSLVMVCVFMGQTKLGFCASVEKGKPIVESMIKDKKATLLFFGAATNDPRLELFISDIPTWHKLSQDDKESTCLYVKSFIEVAKKNPDPYLNISSSAPFYKKSKANVQNICNDCWGISSSSSVIVMGDEAWKRNEYKGETDLSFSSVFNKEAPAQIKDTRSSATLDTDDVLQSRAKAFIEKIGKSQSYFGLCSGILISDKRIYLTVTSLWAKTRKADREEFVKYALTLWLNTGVEFGVKDQASDYTIEVRYDGVLRKLASWDALFGFRIY